MKLFSAKVAIASVSIISGKSDEWILTGAVIDNTGSFLANAVKVGQKIYAYSLNNAEEKSLRRYEITKINSIAGANFDVNIRWNDEATTEYTGPNSEFDAVVGEITNGDQVAISGVGNGVNIDMVIEVRNVDTRLSTFKVGDIIDGGTF